MRLLGAVDVVSDGDRLRSFDSPRLHRFLAMIVLAGAARHRGQLAFELWPDSDEGQARTNLRKLLHDLRQALPDSDEYIEIDNQAVRWRSDAAAEVDVVAFRAAVATGDLDLAAQLYTGDLLPACYDDWTLGVRDSLRAEALAVFRALITTAVAAGDHEVALEHARRILDLEPTDEAAARIEMESLLAGGDRAGALRAYHRFAGVLMDELGTAPSVETIEVYRNMQVDGEVTPAVEVAAPVTDSPFVGRVPEWAELTVAWETARRGRAHLVVLTGEPGIGKSRLALEFARRVRDAGDTIAMARAYEAAGRLPWGPVVDLLRVESIRGHIDALEPVWRSELARLLPELARSTAASTGPPSDPAQRHRLFDAIGRALVDRDRPRLLVIDDLQWCDTETIELMGYIIRSEPTAPIMVVGTLRSEELSDRDPVRARSSTRSGMTEPSRRFHSIASMPPPLRSWLVGSRARAITGSSGRPTRPACGARPRGTRCS